MPSDKLLLRISVKKYILSLMKNNIVYYADRKNPLVWLSVLLMLISAAARIAYFSALPPQGAGPVIVRIALPLAACLLFSLQLLLKGRKLFCVTVRPVILIALYFIINVISVKLAPAMTAACIFVCIMTAAAWIKMVSGDYRGKVGGIIIFLIVALLCFLEKSFRNRIAFAFAPPFKDLLFVSDICMVLALFCVFLCAKSSLLGDDPAPRLGDRIDGYLIRNNYPMAKLSPFFMNTRVGSSNYIFDSFETENLEKYIRQKRREGLKHFGITHAIIAAYVRATAELPRVNRFIAGQRVFHRREIVVSMVIKKEMSVKGLETVIKPKFCPEDTAKDVYEKYNDALSAVRTPQLDSSYDNLTRILDYIPPFLLSSVVALLRLLDYFGWMPVRLIELSPFHSSMFITSMGSLGIPPIYHHLYDFGNIPVFCSFGAKRTVNELEKDGTVVTKRYVDYTWVTDERIADGFYYASVLKTIKYYLIHPEKLDEPPKRIVRDEP